MATRVAEDAVPKAEYVDDEHLKASCSSMIGNLGNRGDTLCLVVQFTEDVTRGSTTR